jgi:hypothetical protein
MEPAPTLPPPCISPASSQQVFPSLLKPNARVTQRLASLYGLKSSMQGSGKRRQVVVSTTPRTALPLGRAFLEVGALLATYSAAHAWGAGAGGLPSPVGKQGKATEAKSGAWPPRSMGEAIAGDGGEGKGRWNWLRGAAGKKQGGGKAGGVLAPVAASSGQPRRASGGPGGRGRGGGVSNRPMAFVSSGFMNGGEEEGVEVAEALAVAVAASPLPKHPGSRAPEAPRSSAHQALEHAVPGGATAVPPALDGDEERGEGGGVFEDAAAGLGPGGATHAVRCRRSEAGRSAQSTDAGAAMGLLEVYEDRGGGGGSSEEGGGVQYEEGEEGGLHAGLGSRGAVYTR